MHRSIAVFLLCCCSLPAKVTVQPDESDKEGVLQVLFVMSSGDEISREPDITVEKLVDGKPVAKREAGRSMKLNYGTYRLKASLPGCCYPVEKIVRIQDAFQVTSLCFFPSPVESPWDGNLIRGSISEKSRQKDCRWVRFMSPFADGEVSETKAGRDGRFALENVRPGKYVAFTIGKTGICETSGVTIQFNPSGKAIYDLIFPWAPFQAGEAKSSTTHAAP